MAASTPRSATTSRTSINVNPRGARAGRRAETREGNMGCRRCRNRRLMGYRTPRGVLEPMGASRTARAARQYAALRIPPTAWRQDVFQGILIRKDEQGYRAALESIDDAQLPDGDVTVRVAASTLNYKDGLAITGKSPVVRQFPMVPGIDLVGTVETSTHADWKPGDQVVLNGWGVGETHWGGLAEKARLKGDWLVPLPSAFSEKQAVSIGTAGYTAMLCVLALERQGVKPADGEIVVTGAAGGGGRGARGG